MVQLSYEDSLQNAQLLVEKGLTDKAVRLINKIISSEPDRAEAYFMLGALYRRQWRPREAIEVFTQAISSTDSQPAVLHQEIAITLAEVHAWNKALEHIQKSLSLKPHYAPSLYVKAMILAQTGAPKKALEIYRQLGSTTSDNAMVHFRIGELQESLHQLKEAEKSYQRAIEITPNVQSARFRLGKMLLVSGNAKQAERELASSVLLAPKHMESHLELAHSLTKLGRTIKAEYHFKRALELNPTSSEVHLSYGNFCVKQRRLEQGRELLRQFEVLSNQEKNIKELAAEVDHTPNNFKAKMDLITLLLKQDLFPLALRYCQRFLLQDQPEPQHFLLLAHVYEEWDRTEDSVRTIEAAAKLFPKNNAIQEKLSRNRNPVDSYNLIY